MNIIMKRGGAKKNRHIKKSREYFNVPIVYLLSKFRLYFFPVYCTDFNKKLLPKYPLSPVKPQYGLIPHA